MANQGWRGTFSPWGKTGPAGHQPSISKSRGQIPKNLQNRLQCLQNFAAGYVLGKYANILDVINLNWLPVDENTKCNASKLTYQGLHDKSWPKYLPVKLIKGTRNLWSDKAGPVTMVKRILSSNRLMKFVICYQLILEYVQIRNLFSIRLEVFIRIKLWVWYCPYKVFFYFFFSYVLFQISVQL